MDQKLLITVPVYGDLYSDIWLNYQLKAFLDPTNIEKNKERLDFAVYTDAETQEKIQRHPNFAALVDLIPTTRIFKFTWPDNADRFMNRYQVLISTFRMSVVEAMKCGSYLSAIVADLVPAKGYIEKLLKPLDEGHDAVFMLPLRSAYETIKDALDQEKGALSPIDLCDHGLTNLHPMWWACLWDNPLFTKLPFSLLWSTGHGLLARSFSITPISFKPMHEMISVGKEIDVEVPGMFKNPYWCHDWTDAPIIGVEPLRAFYPTFGGRPADPDKVKSFSVTRLCPSQRPFLKEKLYYPNKAIVNISPKQEWDSDEVVEKILCD